MKDERLKLSEVLEELYHLREENQSLKIDNDFLQRQNAACKMRCSKYALEIQQLSDEIADLRFTHKYLTAEEAGKAFACELLGKTYDPIDVEEAEFIENGERHYYEMGTAIYGDDF